MREKRTLFHIIDSLGLGGAEVLLKSTLNLLPQFDHLVIYLHKPDYLVSSFNDNVEFACLDHQGWKDSVKTIRRIRQLIQRKRPVLVHSHLFYSTLFTRLAIPAGVPLVSSIHSRYSVDAFQKNRKSVWAERLTLRKRHALIGVSQNVLDDYLQWVNFTGKKFVLYNFLPHRFFQKKAMKKRGRILRCVAVGTLKEAKNYSFLLQVFEHLVHDEIALDIYGGGPLEEELQQAIRTKNLKVHLRGATDKVQEFLPQYDLFIQASGHEGFGISVIEAMAMELPVFLSDIPVFREITNGHAHFFSLASAEKTAQQLLVFAKDEDITRQHVHEGADVVKRRYTEEQYIQNILAIYEHLIYKGSTHKNDLCVA